MTLNRLNYLKRPENIWLLLETFFSLLWIRALISRVRITRILEMLDPGAHRKRTFRPGEIERSVKFTDFLVNKVFRTRNPCLLRSMFLFRRMRSAGIDVRIAFGVADLDAEFKGHAWLTLDGKHFLEKEDPSKRYEAVFVYP
jgi:hypothetical protein